MTKLKTCPFCGGKARLMMLDEEGCEINKEAYKKDRYEGQTYDDWVGCVLAYHAVICDDCSIYAPGLNKEDVIEKWNKRARE